MLYRSARERSARSARVSEKDLAFGDFPAALLFPSPPSGDGTGDPDVGACLGVGAASALDIAFPLPM